MVNEGINTKIHKFYDRKNEIKLYVKDSFFFFCERFVTTAGSQLEPSSSFAHDRRATDTLIF